MYRSRRRLAAALLGLAIVGGGLVAPERADAQDRIDYNRLQVGDTLPGGYVLYQRWGPGAFLARRGNDIFYVRGNSVTYLNPRYSIGDQIDDLDPRRRRFRSD